MLGHTAGSRGAPGEEARRGRDALAGAAAAAALHRMVSEPLDPLDDDAESMLRRSAVRNAFEHAWEVTSRCALSRH